MTRELVQDADFDDPLQWRQDGSEVYVDDSKYKFTDPYNMPGVPNFGLPLYSLSAEAGKFYKCKIKVTKNTTTPNGGHHTTIVSFGGATFYDGKTQGTGTFITNVQALTTGGLLFSCIHTGDLFVESVSIKPMHARQIIREAAATTVTGLTTTGSNVYQSRFYNMQQSELPCLLVYTVNEEVPQVNTIGSPRQLLRRAELVIEGKAQATSDIDDTLDDIAEEVENAIGADISLGVGVTETILESTEIEFSGEGEKPIGSVVMRYGVTYVTDEDTAGTIIGN